METTMDPTSMPYVPQVPYVQPQVTAHTLSWNVFRYIGDYLHLFGILALLATLAKNGSCRGISRGTQVLYFLVFITRYLDLLSHSQLPYLVFFKVTYITSTALVLLIFWRWDKTYERTKDTCSLAVLVLPCMAAAYLLATDHTGLEVLWTFSQFLEGFAMVPQYIFCYRDRTSTDKMVTLYVVALGGYRVFYAANWIYKRWHDPHYSDVHSWIGGLIEIAFFDDYVLSRFIGFSALRALVLKVDEKINEIQDAVELKVLGHQRRHGLEETVSNESGNELRQRRGGKEELKEVAASEDV